MNMSKVLRRRTILPITTAAAGVLALFSTAYACTGLGLGFGGTLTLQPDNAAGTTWTSTAVFPNDEASAPSLIRTGTPVNLYTSPSISTDHEMACHPYQASENWTKKAEMVWAGAGSHTYTDTSAPDLFKFYCAVTNNGTGWTTDPVYLI